MVSLAASANELQLLAISLVLVELEVKLTETSLTVALTNDPVLQSFLHLAPKPTAFGLRTPVMVTMKQPLIFQAFRA